jgi:hypothetical protein
LKSGGQYHWNLQKEHLFCVSYKLGGVEKSSGKAMAARCKESI